MSEVNMLLWEILRPSLADAFATESLRNLNIDTASILNSITLPTNALLMALLHQENRNRASSLMREILIEATGGSKMREILAIARTERSSASGRTTDASSIASRKETRASSKISANNDNDATLYYYPNIQCVICKEWLCSRNRYMHMESHYNYRPYRCTAVGCDYTNRKEIFVAIHVRKVHNGEAGVLYMPDNELEKRAWAIAEQSLDQTKLLLAGNGCHQPTIARLTAISGSSTKDVSCKEKFRLRIHNSQRNRKSRLIELGRRRGLIPKLVQKSGQSAAIHASYDASRRRQQSPLFHHPQSAESPFLCAALRQVDERGLATDKVPIPTDRMNSTELAKLLQQRNCMQHLPTRTGTSSRVSNSSVLTALLSGGRK